MVESSGRRFLIYDQGGNRLLVRMRDKILFEKEFEYKIISADLSAEGTLSVITSAQRYASQLHVFDSDYNEEIFTWSSSDEYIVCASASEKNKTIAAAALSANDAGEIVTTVHIFTPEAAVELAKKYNGEVVSADSMQIYRKMNIGTAKITTEEMDGVPHHLIDVLDPAEEFNVFLFKELYLAVDGISEHEISLIEILAHEVESHIDSSHDILVPHQCIRKVTAQKCSGRSEDCVEAQDLQHGYRYVCGRTESEFPVQCEVP